MILLLFTASYPFDKDAEQTFLQVEIKYLKKEFPRVILVPRRDQGNRIPVPDGVELDLSYAGALHHIGPLIALRRSLFAPQFYQEIAASPWLLRHPGAMRRLLAFLLGARMTSAWVQDWLARNRAEAASCLFYTYWFDHAAYGIGLARQRHPQLKLVSRVHGYDLYEEYYYRPPYWPRRRAALGLVDRLYPDSQAGLDYLNARYPDFAAKYQAALLGVPDPGFCSRASGDGVFRVVSCSMLEPVKRIDLLLEGIRRAAERRPEMSIEWTHFGNGERRAMLQDLANRSFPANARGSLPGYTTKTDLMEYYERNPVDVFVNVSATEGTPVAVMEAISCGIPVIATSVGGNVEIASEQNGLLLTPDPSPEQIAEALLGFHDDQERAAAKRLGSREVWRQRYDADANFQAFARELKALRTG